MCILLNLNYAKFGVSDLFFSQDIEEKPLGRSTRSPRPLVKKGFRRLNSGREAVISNEDFMALSCFKSNICFVSSKSQNALLNSGPKLIYQYGLYISAVL